VRPRVSTTYENPLTRADITIDPIMVNELITDLVQAKRSAHELAGPLSSAPLAG
jgi:hypothetical protein